MDSPAKTRCSGGSDVASLTLSGFGRPAPDASSSPEMRLMEHRAARLCASFAEAARACGLKFDDGASINDCADAILKTAKRAKLDPRLYALVWFVKKTAVSAGATDS